MVEKTIDLKDIELVQFLGVKNKNIQEIEQAFPEAKVISRGNKISIKGNENQLKGTKQIVLEMANTIRELKTQNDNFQA